MADLKYLPASAVGIRDRLALLDRVSEAFLAEDMFTGGKCVEANARMEMKGCRNQNTVEPRHFEHLSIIRKARCPFDFCPAGLKMRFVVIAQGGDFDTRGPQQMR